MQFASLPLSASILRAVASEGYSVATPVQAQSIPHVLNNRDLMACAQTGTGKTAAFALPILHQLGAHKPGKPRALVLCPTRELATQISDSFRTYGKHLNIRTTIIFGGVSQHHQVKSVRGGTDVLIATPGRLLDLLNQNLVDLRSVQFLVLDEADRMLDMGFINDIRKIVKVLPQQRQTLMFSATMPSEIRELAQSLLKNPASVQVAPVSSTAQNIEQSVYHVDRAKKADLLAHLYHTLPMARTIVFTRTKHGADRVVRHLHARGIRSEAIHGNKSQSQRERALNNFRANKTPVLVATDIASRGIDIDDITHVVNFDLTHEPETYVHRIGRTARAGAKGTAVSLVDREELGNLRAIERLLKKQIPVSKADHPASVDAPAPVQRHSHDRQASQRPAPATAYQTNEGRRHQRHQSRTAQQRERGHQQAQPKARHPLHANARDGQRGAAAGRPRRRRRF
ncbi:MAG TPA: DEAD/DEAH box helicase [Tepidisphaeraceae bacterium]|jgi:ATP-dependent RNA helicase RhlE